MPINLKEASREWAKRVYQRATEQGHPNPEVVTSLIHEVSRFNPGAAGYNDTIGIGRFTQEQADQIGIDPRDPYRSIDAVIAIDKQNLETFNGDRDFATTAFFVGPDKMVELVRQNKELPPEISGRVQRVNAAVPELSEIAVPTVIKVSTLIPEGEQGSVSDIIETDIRNVDLRILYDRVKTDGVDSQEFLQEYMRRAIDGENVTVGKKVKENFDPIGLE